MNDFLQNNIIVRGASTRQKTVLVGANNSIKNRSEAKDKDFGNDFVNNDAKANRSEIFVSCGGSVLGIREIKVSERTGSK